MVREIIVPGEGEIACSRVTAGAFICGVQGPLNIPTTSWATPDGAGRDPAGRAGGGPAWWDDLPQRSAASLKLLTHWHLPAQLGATGSVRMEDSKGVRDRSGTTLHRDEAATRNVGFCYTLLQPCESVKEKTEPLLARLHILFYLIFFHFFIIIFIFLSLLLSLSILISHSFFWLSFFPWPSLQSLQSHSHSIILFFSAPFWLLFH